MSSHHGFSFRNPPATFSNANAWRSASCSGFTPSNRGFWARFKFRQLASSPSRTRSGTTPTLSIVLSSSPKKSRPAFVFKSCTTGKVVSPRRANPPVPEDRLPASLTASRRKTPMLAIRKLPHASRPSVARLRLRRRAQLRTPNSLSVNCAAARHRFPPNEDSMAAENASPATSNNAPTLKNVSASDVSWRHSAQPLSPRAIRPATVPRRPPRLLLF